MDSLIARVPDEWTVWAFSDSHGVVSGLAAALIEAGLVDRMLRWVAPPRTALVGCGDYIDRGADSHGMATLLRRLASEARAAAGAVVLARGNHEQLPLDLLGGLDEWFDPWQEYGGRATLDSFGVPEAERGDPVRAIRALEASAPGTIGWLETLPQAVRWADVLFVHGGLPPATGPEDLGTTTDRHLWIRGEFFETPWSSGAFERYAAAGIERVVFGHTPLPAGRRVYQEGRSLCLDTNACGNPNMPADAQRMITLVRLARDTYLDEADAVVVRTEAAPDARRPD